MTKVNVLYGCTICNTSMIVMYPELPDGKIVDCPMCQMPMEIPDVRL